MAQFDLIRFLVKSMSLVVQKQNLVPLVVLEFGKYLEYFELAKKRHVGVECCGVFAVNLVAKKVLGPSLEFGIHPLVKRRFRSMKTPFFATVLHSIHKNFFILRLFFPHFFSFLNFLLLSFQTEQAETATERYYSVVMIYLPKKGHK